ncbi:MAG: hypothetical protein DRP33_01330 [Thermotogae bacterium]|nr:MAG: hypothetical protein DRP33_01330 [Thermotogota bacterium]
MCFLFLSIHPTTAYNPSDSQVYIIRLYFYNSRSKPIEHPEDIFKNLKIVYIKNMKRRTFRILKGFFRIHVGFALVRSWFLDKSYPRRTSVHLFDMIKRVAHRNRTTCASKK